MVDSYKVKRVDTDYFVQLGLMDNLHQVCPFEFGEIYKDAQGV